MGNFDAITIAKQVIQDEVVELQAMADRLGAEFDEAVQLLLNTKGRIVIVGMGKSGIIGKKIAATLSSMGSPAFFVHPGEAFHGDLGMITPSDAVVMISNSGETEELLRLIPFLQHQKNSVVAITGKTASTLAKNATVVLDIGVSKEACMLNLAPTSSTTATLVIGDAISVALSTARAFQPEDFARFHPGGSLGRKLIAKVKDFMRIVDLPIVSRDSKLLEILESMTKARLGITLVVENGSLVGIASDGDVRRGMMNTTSPMELTAQQIMNSQPKTIGPEAKLREAEELMALNRISNLVVVDENKSVLGVIEIYA